VYYKTIQRRVEERRVEERRVRERVIYTITKKTF
jgi:hypothetical protein